MNIVYIVEFLAKIHEHAAHSRSRIKIICSVCQLLRSLQAISVLCERILSGAFRFSHIKCMLLNHTYVPNGGIDLLQNSTLELNHTS